MAKFTSILFFLTFSVVAVPLFGVQSSAGVENVKNGPSDLYVPDPKKYGTHNTITIKNKSLTNQQSNSDNTKSHSSGAK